MHRAIELLPGSDRRKVSATDVQVSATDVQVSRLYYTVKINDAKDPRIIDR